MKWVWLNSAGTLGRLEPPEPVPVGSPVCAMNPGMTRWKFEAVIELLLHQRLDLRDVLGRPVRAKLDRDLAVLRRENNGVVGILGRPGGRSGEKREPERGASAASEHERTL